MPYDAHYSSHRQPFAGIAAPARNSLLLARILLALSVTRLTSRRSPHFVRQAGCSPARSRPYGTQSGLLTSRNPTLPIVALTRATSVPDARVCSLFLALRPCYSALFIHRASFLHRAAALCFGQRPHRLGLCAIRCSLFFAPAPLYSLRRLQVP